MDSEPSCGTIVDYDHTAASLQTSSTVDRLTQGPQPLPTQEAAAYVRWLDRQKWYCHLSLDQQVNTRTLTDFFGTWDDSEAFAVHYKTILAYQRRVIWNNVRPRLATFAERCGGQDHLHIEWSGGFGLRRFEPRGPSIRVVNYKVTITRDFDEVLETLTLVSKLPGSPTSPLESQPTLHKLQLALQSFDHKFATPTHQVAPADPSTREATA